MSSVSFHHTSSGIKLLEEKDPGPSDPSVFSLIPIPSPLPMKERTSITTNNSPASPATPDADYIINNIIDLLNTISIYFPSFLRKISSLNLNVSQQLPNPASTSSSFDTPLIPMTSVNKIKSLKLLQWNRNKTSHSIRNKREVIVNIINDYDILALSETWLDSHILIFLTLPIFIYLEKMVLPLNREA